MSNDERRPLSHFWTPNYWPLWLVLALLRLTIMLPHNARLAVGFSLGRLAHRLMPARRAVTRRNIELCFPELPAEERDALAKKHFEALGASAVEMALGMWGSDDELERLTRVEGAEHLTKYSDQGIGVILACAHFTSLEISGRMLSRAIPPFDVVYRRNRNPFFTEITRHSRERSARKTIGKEDIREMVRSLRAGTPVWYAPDQAFKGKNAALVPFFGVPAMMTTATGQLAKLGKAVVVPYFPRRLDDGSYIIQVLPAITEIPTGDLIRDSELYNESLEKQVRQCPEQYYWVHKKFKGRPDDLPDAYADLDALK